VLDDCRDEEVGIKVQLKAELERVEGDEENLSGNRFFMYLSSFVVCCKDFI
jgi:hypothetical protein